MICNTCFNLKLLISNDNDKENNLKLLNEHIEMVKKLKSANEKIFIECLKNQNTKLTMDGSCGISLPSFRRIPQEFCMKKNLPIGIYGIINDTDNTSEIFTNYFRTGASNKGVDHVLSCFLIYLSRNLDKIKDLLVIEFDNAARECKNYIFIAFIHYLCFLGILKEVILFTNVVGHTKSSADRTFGAIKTKLKNKEKVLTIQELNEVFSTKEKKRNNVVNSITSIEVKSVVKIKEKICSCYDKINGIASYHYFKINKSGVMAKKFTFDEESFDNILKWNENEINNLIFYYYDCGESNDDDLIKNSEFLREKYNSNEVKKFWNDIIEGNYSLDLQQIFLPNLQLKTDDIVLEDVNKDSKKVEENNENVKSSSNKKCSESKIFKEIIQNPNCLNKKRTRNNSSKTETDNKKRRKSRGLIKKK